LIIIKKTVARQKTVNMKVFPLSQDLINQDVKWIDKKIITRHETALAMRGISSVPFRAFSAKEYRNPIKAPSKVRMIRLSDLNL